MSLENRKLRPLYAPSLKVEPGVLSVVIPALDEESGIEDICSRVHAAEELLRAVGINDLEVIVVDDGSQDGTADVVSRLPYVRLIKHPQNRGYGAAIKTGFSLSRGEFLAFLDADSTYPPESFAELCRSAIREEADVVVGSRRSGQGSEMPRVRRIGNFIWSALLSWVSKRRVEDPASGMRVIRRTCLPQLYPLPDGLNFTPVMNTRAVHEDLKVIEVPIPYMERSGSSKLSVVGDGTRFLKTILWTALEYNPARLVGFAGLLALTVSGLIGVGLVIARLMGVTELGPWGVFSLFNSLVLAVSGFSIFSLGISFNYLVGLFHSKPVRQRVPLTGLFGRSIDRHFGWLGILVTLAGAGVGIVSLRLGFNGWDIARLWLWMLGSASFVLIGLQMFFSWTLMRVLETLSERSNLVQNDLGLTDGSIGWEPREVVQEEARRN